MGSEDVKRQAQNVYPHEAARRDGGAGRIRLEDAQGRAQRSDARLGDQRREHVLHHRHRRRAASVSDDGARLPVASSATSASCRCRRSSAASPTRCIACVGGGSNAMGIFYPYITHAERAPDRRRGGGRRPRERQARGDAHRRAGPACCTAIARICCRTRTARSSRRTRSRRASTIPASVPSTRGSRTRRAPSTSRSPTTKRSQAFHDLLPPRRHHSGARIEPCARVCGEDRADAAEGPDPARQSLGPRRQGHAHRRRTTGARHRRSAATSSRAA